MRALIAIVQRWRDHRDEHWQGHKIWYVVRLTVNGQEKVAGYFPDRLDALLAAMVASDAMKMADIEVAPISYEKDE